MKAKISAQVRSNSWMQVILILYFMSLGACANNTATPLVPTEFIPIIPTLANTSTLVPTLSPTPILTFTSTPLNLHPQVVVLAADLPEPDDLLLTTDGSILISDVKDGTIKQYGLDGQLRFVLSGLSEPEGMAIIPDGSLIIAEQGNNRLVRYDFRSNTLSPFLNLKNNTNRLGVDGILWDGKNLIVPDSPNGTVLEISLDQRTVRQLSSGLVRPTGAWSEPDGNLLIADENGNAVWRLHKDGALEKIADFSIPDDVIEDSDGNIFIVTLGDDAIHVITADRRQDMILVSRLSDPQGIIFDSDGNLIVTDSGHHRLIKVLIH
jgi:sugar lactone lactonase YvrE